MRNELFSTSFSSDGRCFYTDSLYLAAFLHAHGLWLSNAETDERGRHRFAFRDSGERETLVRQFRQGPKAMVDARTFMRAIEEMKDRVGRVRVVRYDDSAET
jgi:hypothetical protein